MARRFPFIAVFAAAVIPHAFAAVFNYFYNQGAVVQTFEHPRQETYWNWLSLVMNSTAFPLGAFLTWWLVRPVAKVLNNGATHPTLARSAQSLTDPTLARSAQTWPLAAQGARDQEELSRARRVALRLGHYTVAVGVSEWVVAGMMYPLVLNLLPGGLNMQQNLAFLASLVFCGLIAGSYPFFLVTLLSIRVFYPALLAQKGPGPERAGGPKQGWAEEDAPWLERLSQQSTIYLPIAGGVPMLAVLILAVFRPDHQQYYFALLAALGAAGLLVSYLLLRVIQNDLKALQNALGPSSDSFAPSSKTF